MPDSGLSDLLRSLPTIGAFLSLLLLSALVLAVLRVKPIASALVALSIPGTVGFALTFAYILFYYFTIIGFQGPYSLLRVVRLALLGTFLFPSYAVSPVVCFFALRRYLSRRPDYAVGGFGWPIAIVLLIASVAASAIIATGGNDYVP